MEKVGRSKRPNGTSPSETASPPSPQGLARLCVLVRHTGTMTSVRHATQRSRHDSPSATHHVGTPAAAHHRGRLGSRRRLKNTQANRRPRRVVRPGGREPGRTSTGTRDSQRPGDLRPDNNLGPSHQNPKSRRRGRTARDTHHRRSWRPPTHRAGQQPGRCRRRPGIDRDAGG